MASGKEYLHFILEQLSDLDDMPRPGGIRVGSSSSSNSGSSPPIILGLSQILCKHRNAVQIEQNLFKAEVAQAAAALFSK